MGKHIWIHIRCDGRPVGPDHNKAPSVANHSHPCGESGPMWSPLRPMRSQMLFSHFYSSDEHWGSSGLRRR